MYEAIFGKRSIQRGKNITVERDENTRAVEERPRREEGWGNIGAKWESGAER